MLSTILWPFATVLSFGANTLVTFSIGTGMKGDLPNRLRELLRCQADKSNAVISSLYPSLVTPAGWAFSIWSVIFVGEGLSLLWQCAAPRDLRELLVPAAPYLCAGFLLQGAWTVAFAQEKIALSAGLLAGVTACIAGAYRVTRQVSDLNDEARTYGLEPASGSRLGLGSTACTYLCTLPYGIHLAWLSVATLVNTNVALVKHGFNAATLVKAATATKCLAGVGGVSFFGKLLLATAGLLLEVSRLAAEACLHICLLVLCLSRSCAACGRCRCCCRCCCKCCCLVAGGSSDVMLAVLVLWNRRLLVPHVAACTWMCRRRWLCRSRLWMKLSPSWPRLL
jgi:hypothetical protein